MLPTRDSAIRNSQGRFDHMVLTRENKNRKSQGGSDRDVTGTKSLKLKPVRIATGTRSLESEPGKDVHILPTQKKIKIENDREGATGTDEEPGIRAWKRFTSCLPGKTKIENDGEGATGGATGTESLKREPARVATGTKSLETEPEKKGLEISKFQTFRTSG
jgi:hypothetical protein